MDHHEDRSYKDKDYLIGINYFSGWWRDLPNKYIVNGNDWRLRYPERIPMLGCYNDQETMDAEIVAASNYGIDFFMMLWYVEKPERHVHGTKLNSGIRNYLASGENHRMRFCIEFCNHPPFQIMDDELWESSCREWVEMMRHDSYLRINGKAVFKVHGLDYFYEQSERDIKKMTHRIEILREMAVKEEVGPLLIGGGIVQLGFHEQYMHELTQTIDFTATYMDLPDYPQQMEEDHTYEELLQFAVGGWERNAKHSLVPYMPYVPSGWNPKPWGDSRGNYLFPNKAEWKDALQRVKYMLDKHPTLRLPSDKTSGQKVFSIYAWNEFAEGGIMAPTLGDGWMKLEAIREIFG